MVKACTENAGLCPTLPRYASDAKHSSPNVPRHGLTQDQTTAPSERLRPVTWRVWLAWVLVTALDPVLSSIYATASGKQISRHAEHTTLIGTALLGTVFVAFLAAPILQ